MFEFLSLDEVKSIPEDLAHFGGVPDYREIVLSLSEPQHWFVIVDFMITSSVFAIRLCKTDDLTPVITICGKNHMIVAPSFAGFLEAYFANPFDVM